jgi:hypothetical protein
MEAQFWLNLPTPATTWIAQLLHLPDDLRARFILGGRAHLPARLSQLRILPSRHRRR